MDVAEFNGPQNERTLLANLNDVPNFNEDLQSWHAPIILNTAFIASGDLIFTLGVLHRPPCNTRGSDPGNRIPPEQAVSPDPVSDPRPWSRVGHRDPEESILEECALEEGSLQGGSHKEGSQAASGQATSKKAVSKEAASKKKSSQEGSLEEGSLQGGNFQSSSRRRQFRRKQTQRPQRRRRCGHETARQARLDRRPTWFDTVH